MFGFARNTRANPSRSPSACSGVPGSVTALRALRDRHATELCRILEVIDHDHFRVQGNVFRQISQHCLDGLRLIRYVVPIYHNPARTWLEEPAQHFHDGRLSGPVVAEQPNNLAGADGKIHRIHGQKVTIGPTKLFYFDQSVRLRTFDPREWARLHQPIFGEQA